MGDSLRNSIDGGMGDDTLVGNGVGDADYLTGGLGNDSIFGDGDILVLEQASGAVTVNFGAGTISSTQGEDTFAGITRVSTGIFDDTLLGDSLTNHLDGGAGNDTADAGAGDDHLEASSGDDSFLGGTGSIG